MKFAFATLAAVLLLAGRSAHASAAPLLAPIAITASSGVAKVPSPTSLHLDAHDGGILQVNGVFYMYGTAYNCGFQFGIPGTRYCGVKVYASTDLTNWVFAAQPFNPSGGDWQRVCAPGGCFRPHVVYNPNTQRYVMWLNVFTGTYRVLTAPTPAGPWTLTVSSVSVPQASGDENLFVDTDGVGYLIRTDLAGRQVTNQSHELAVDRLDSTFTRLLPDESRPAVGFVEAPTMWLHDGTYYLAYSNPACPYCTGAGTSVVTAPTPMGPWSASYSISGNSCGGQPTNVLTADSGLTLYQSDQWVRLGTDWVTRNQALAHEATVPLSYADDGTVQPVRCPRPRQSVYQTR